MAFVGVLVLAEATPAPRATGTIPNGVARSAWGVASSLFLNVWTKGQDEGRIVLVTGEKPL